MREVPIYDARQQLGQLVDELALSGEAVAITRHGRPVAVLTALPRMVPVVAFPSALPGPDGTLPADG